MDCMELPPPRKQGDSSLKVAAQARTSSHLRKCRSNILDRTSSTPERSSHLRRSSDSWEPGQSGLPHYVYQSLPDARCIRLIQLLRYDEYQRRLYARLRTFSLENCPSYRALSYTWDSPMQSMLTPSRAHHEQDQEGSCELLVFSDTVQVNHLGNSKQNSNQVWFGPEETLSRSATSIPVTKNLWDALTTLSARGHGSGLDSPCFFWVDAICINQPDHVERAFQLLLMGDIYGKADSDIVWLSKETCDLDTVIWMHKAVYPSLKAASKKYPSRDAFYTWMDQFDPLDPDFWAKEMSIGLSAQSWAQKWRSYWSFFGRRTWFNRAWVVQEVLLAQKVTLLCGEELFSWEDMIDFLTMINNTKWYQELRINLISEEYQKALTSMFDLLRLSACFESVNLQQSKYLQRRAKKYGAQSKIEFWSLLLMELLRCSRTRLCTFPEDKVISLLGLLQKFLPEDAAGLLDAKPEAGVVEIYTWIASLCLENSSSLFFLNRKEDRLASFTPGLPSWVPDFCSRFWPGAVDASPRFDAALTRTIKNVSPHVVESELQVYGVSIGTVQGRVEALAGDPDIIPCLEFATGLDVAYHATDQERMEVLWRTLIIDSCGNGKKTNPAPREMGVAFRSFVLSELSRRLKDRTATAQYKNEYAEYFVDLVERLRKSPVSEALLPSPEEIRNFSASTGLNSAEDTSSEHRTLAKPYRVEFVRSYFFRALFQTSTGLIGIGPPSLQPNDQLFIIQGGRTPFILRKREDGETYELIGGCYVHGIMYGEMMTDELRAQFATVRIF